MKRAAPPRFAALAGIAEALDAEAAVAEAAIGSLIAVQGISPDALGHLKVVRLLHQVPKLQIQEHPVGDRAALGALRPGEKLRRRAVDENHLRGYRGRCRPHRFQEDALTG